MRFIRVKKNKVRRIKTKQRQTRQNKGKQRDNKQKANEQSQTKQKQTKADKQKSNKQRHTTVYYLTQPVRGGRTRSIDRLSHRSFPMAVAIEKKQKKFKRTRGKKEHRNTSKRKLCILSVKWAGGKARAFCTIVTHAVRVRLVALVDAEGRRRDSLAAWVVQYIDWLVCDFRRTAARIAVEGREREAMARIDRHAQWRVYFLVII